MVCRGFFFFFRGGGAVDFPLPDSSKETAISKTVGVRMPVMLQSFAVGRSLDHVSAGVVQSAICRPPADRRTRRVIGPVRFVSRLRTGVAARNLARVVSPMLYQTFPIECECPKIGLAERRHNRIQGYHIAPALTFRKNQPRSERRTYG